MVDWQRWRATHLPSEVMWAQPEEDFPGGFEVDRQVSGMLRGPMNIPKVPRQADRGRHGCVWCGVVHNCLLPGTSPHRCCVCSTQKVIGSTPAYPHWQVAY
jgi:hypothetical protein